MNSLLASLVEVCRRYPLQEKVLIVPGYGQGRELCEALAWAGGGWVSLHPETTTGLASQIAGEYLADKNVTLLTGCLAVAVVEAVFQELEDKKSLQYFARKGNSPGLARAIASSIFELRNAGVVSDSLQETSFVSAAKGQDMLALLKAYERYLEQHQYIDTPGLLSLACHLLSGSNPPAGDVIYLLPDFLKLYPLQLKLVKTLAAGKLQLLKTDPVYGIEGIGSGRPGPVGKDDPSPSTDVERLPWLYWVDLSPPPVSDGSLSCFQAYGLRNEVREIFRRLQAEGTPLDTVTVAYTSSEYIPVFYTLARLVGVGLTIGEGIPGSFTGPGRVLQGLSDWIRNGFPASGIRELILSGDTQLRTDKSGDPALSPAAAARLLRGSGIGWGRDRYVLLKKMAVSLKERAGLEVEAEAESGRREQLLRQSEQAGQLYEIIQPLLAALPVPGIDGRISFRDNQQPLGNSFRAGAGQR